MMTDCGATEVKLWEKGLFDFAYKAVQQFNPTVYNCTASGCRLSWTMAEP